MDLRWAARSIRRNPAFSGACVVLLAFGVGANVAVLGVANALLFRGRPGIEDYSSLVWIAGTDDRNTDHLGDISYPEFTAYREAPDVFAGVAASMRTPVQVESEGVVVPVFGEIVSSGYFTTLGVHPTLGRFFAPGEMDDRNADAVAVISNRLWRRLGGDPNVIGLSLRLNGHSFTVIGVAAPGFVGPEAVGTNDVWLPIALGNLIAPAPYDRPTMRIVRHFRAFGRLQPGVDVKRAQATLGTIATRLSRDYPTTNVGMSVDVIPMRGGVHPKMYRWLSDTFGRVLAVTVLVLILTCANLGGLLLSRLASRRKEIAIQLALGAPRHRIVGRVTMEALLLAFMGGAGGFVAAHWVAQIFAPMIRVSGEASYDFSPSFVVALGTAVIAAFAGAIFGVLPALAATRRNVNDDLKGIVGARLGHTVKTQDVLVCAQVAIALALCVAAGLTTRSARATSIGTPFMVAADSIVTVAFNSTREGWTRDLALEFYMREAETLAQTPGIRDVTIAALVPHGENTLRQEISRADVVRNTSTFLSRINVVGPNYFRTLGIKMLHGRDFSDHDRENSPMVAVVNQAAAVRLWPGIVPVGQIITSGNDDDRAEIVGVVESGKAVGLDQNAEPMVYYPVRQWGQVPNGAMIIASATADPSSAIRTIVRQLQGLPNPPRSFQVLRLADIAQQTTAGARTAAKLLSLSGVLALSLTIVGVYALISHKVAQREREFGLRMALGAGPMSLFRLVAADGAKLLLFGCVPGLIAAVLLSRILRGVIVGIPAWDISVYLFALILTSSATFLACVIPSYRVSKLSPGSAMRIDTG